ncbi:MAG TPA: sugar ABC transporter substrate-binding protein [Clostridiales bacterium]|jgi:multiple sugar transport system substrate-binding protein|nr:sugar ABC transporter substrate-binding protein [Clostridiales bacterium]
MNKLRKVTSLILAMSLSASVLAGCGNGSTESQASQASQAQASSQAGGQVKLVWALWDKDKTTYYQPLIDAYKEKNPNVTIEMKDLGSTDYQTALGTQLAGGDSGLDIITVKDVPGYAAMTNAGQLEDLTQYIKDNNIDLKKYGGITDQVTVDGKLYELPFRSDFWLLYYNKDLFDKAKVDYPTNDMTFEQYDALARKLVSGSGNDKTYGAHYHTWRSAVQLFGILDGKHTVLDYQDGYTWMKPYYEMVLKQQDDGVVMDYATLKTSSTHYSGVFENSSVAMMNMGSWFISTLMADNKAGKSTAKNFGIVKYPHAEGVEPGSTLATITGLAVASSSKNKEAALDFVKFASGEEGAVVVAKTGTIPAIMSDDVIEFITSMEGFPTDPNSKEALKTSHTYLEMPMNAKSAEVETALNDDHDAIMTKSISIDEGLKKMSEDVKAILG